VSGEEVVQGAGGREFARKCSGIKERERPMRDGSDSNECEENNRAPEDSWGFGGILHDGSLGRAGHQNGVMGHSGPHGNT